MATRNTGDKGRIAATAAAATIGLTLAGQANAATILMDFGASGTQTTVDAVGRTWTNVPDSNDQPTALVLNSTTGADSGYRLAITNPPGTTNAAGFNGSNTNGAAATGAAAARNYPLTATQDSLFGNTATFGVGIVQAARLTFSNLNPNERYAFDFFASRTGVSDNRETEYHVVGGNTNTSVFLDIANNTGNITGLAGVSPDANNQIVIDVDPGPNNNNASGFYYLGVLEINSSPVPEPASLAAIGAVGLALLSRRRRSA